MQELFSAAQQRLVFNNSLAARGTTRGSFNLTIGYGFPGNLQRDLDRGGQHNAIGYTPRAGNRWGSLGAVNIFNMQTEYQNVFGDTEINPNELASALGGAGAHESGHYFLQMGHSSDGLMRAGAGGMFMSGLIGRQFTAAQAQKLLIAFCSRFIELEAFAAHEKQRHHIAEIHTG